MKKFMIALFLFLFATYAQATILTYRHYNNISEATCETKIAGGTPYIGTDSSSPDGPNVLVFPHPAGLTGGNTPAECWDGFSNQKDIWVQYYFKKSSNWQYQDVLDKHFFMKNNAPDSHASGMLMGTGYGGGSDCGYPEANGKGLWTEVQALYGGDGAGADVYSPNTSKVCSVNPLSRNVWHKVKMHLVMNTSGSRNGTIQLWIDDVLVANHVGTVNHNKYGSTTSFNLWNWNPIWGGMGGKINQIQNFYVDGLVIATQESDLPAPASVPLPGKAPMAPQTLTIN